MAFSPVALDAVLDGGSAIFIIYSYIVNQWHIWPFCRMTAHEVPPTPKATDVGIRERHRTSTGPTTAQIDRNLLASCVQVQKAVPVNSRQVADILRTAAYAQRELQVCNSHRTEG